ncbi:MAG: 3-keto-disaccharide hydrolase [Terriglobia bacterium]
MEAKKILAAILLSVAFGSCRIFAGQAAVFKWPLHDRNRPAPRVITPGECSTQNHAGAPPSDAFVLFNGKDLSNWKAVRGGPARWRLGEGYFQVVPGTGDIETDQTFHDFQLHVEWATPTPPHGEDQGRGNSGVFLQGLYEVQVLDSFHSKTYPDGEAGAIYGEYPPLVNACRPPSQWQTYDIVFHAPRFLPNGDLYRPARVTVFQNGVLVQDNVALTGPTEYKVRPPYQPGVVTGPLRLQDHHNLVRYRNIWIRELKASAPN